MPILPLGRVAQVLCDFDFIAPASGSGEGELHGGSVRGASSKLKIHCS